MPKYYAIIKMKKPYRSSVFSRKPSRDDAISEFADALLTWRVDETHDFLEVEIVEQKKENK